MSASNWAKCPVCGDRFPLRPDEYNFREDYEIYGAETGIVKVRYGGHCTSCDSGVDFQFEKAVVRKEPK